MHVKDDGLLSHELEGPWYRELTMYMCGLCRLALVKLARVAKRSRVATKNDNLELLQPLFAPFNYFGAISFLR